MLVFSLGVIAAAPDALVAQAPDAMTRWTACDALPADAATDLSGPVEERLRIEEITTAFPPITRGLRRPSDRLDDCGDRDAAWMRLGAVTLRPARPILHAESNSGYPEDRNNGGLWAGRGMAGELQAGFRVDAGPLSGGFLPAVRWSQNLDYTRRRLVRPGFSPEANPYYSGIDLPQRMGADDVRELALGQSYLRVDWRGVAAGLSTENVWLGPAMRNPILLSNTAEGFPHAFLGTSEPADVWIGRLGVSVLLGRVEESDYFDSIERNDDGRIAAWTVTFEPRGVEQLELGVGRVFRWDPDFAPDGSLAWLGLGTADDPGLGMLSLFGRFRMPDSGADVWLEWARTDGYRSVVDDLLTEPEHSQAFVAGFQKVSREWVPLRIVAELVHLQEKQREREGRSLPIYYTDPAVRQGHTHRGQLLGAGVGPGADAQYVELDYLFERGLAGLFVERYRRNDASAVAIRTRFDSYLHDTQVSAGARANLHLYDLLLDASLAWSHRFQREFRADDRNLRLTLTMSWWP